MFSLPGLTSGRDRPLVKPPPSPAGASTAVAIRETLENLDLPDVDGDDDIMLSWLAEQRFGSVEDS